MINTVVNNGIQPAASGRKEAVKQETATDASLRPSAEQNLEIITSEQETVAPEPAELESAVSRLNDYVQNVQRTLSFSIEETTGVTVVQVYDSETEELIRQIPAEDTIKLAVSIEDRLASLFLKEQA